MTTTTGTIRLTFGVCLRLARAHYGLTQQELAGRVGMPQTTLARWEKRDNPPRAQSVYMSGLENFLKLPPGDLRWGKLPLSMVHQPISVTIQDPYGFGTGTTEVMENVIPRHVEAFITYEEMAVWLGPGWERLSPEVQRSIYDFIRYQFWLLDEKA